MFETMLWPKGSARWAVRPAMGCSRVTSACTAKPMNATCAHHAAIFAEAIFLFVPLPNPLCYK